VSDDLPIVDSNFPVDGLCIGYRAPFHDTAARIDPDFRHLTSASRPATMLGHMTHRVPTTIVRTTSAESRLASLSLT